ncbi:MAG: DUF1566 domain-containing protein [Gammaproteobacteria bacterium]|nr:MAG: DUF1566 domain-containing protein [Gammaproteobacteria bacterium]
MQRVFWGIALSVLLAGSANAALLSRAGGQAYYDTVLDITWLANANLADTNAFGVTDINANGTMTWAIATDWIAAMNTAAYLGISNWRLPTVVDTGTLGCNFAYTGTDCGYNVDLSTGEMAHLFYSTLGNTGHYDTGGSPTGCGPPSPYCLTNTGPFSNLQPDYYWSGTTYAPSSSHAWFFAFFNGLQHRYNKGHYSFYAWAVSPGDALVPVPAAVWLFGSALGVMGLLRRKAQTGTGRLRCRVWLIGLLSNPASR